MSYGGWKNYVIPFYGYKYTADRLDEGDENVAQSQADKEQAIQDQATAETALGEAIAKKDEVTAKQAERKADQEQQLVLESGVRKYEKETRARLFGYDYTATLDALGDSEITLAQDQIDTLRDAVQDEQRDNIPEVKIPFALIGGLLALGGAVLIAKKKKIIK